VRQNFCQNFQFFHFFFQKSWDFKIWILISLRFCFSRWNNFLRSIHIFLVTIVLEIPNLLLSKLKKKKFSSNTIRVMNLRLNFWVTRGFISSKRNSYFDQWKGRARGKKLNYLLLLALHLLRKAFFTCPFVVCGHSSEVPSLIDLHLLNARFSKPTSNYLQTVISWHTWHLMI